MEWTTILGLFLGFAAMCGVLMFGKSEASFATFIDPPALLMVFGGAAAVVLIGFPVRQLKNLVAMLRKTIRAPKNDPAELIDEIVRLAEVARKDGLLRLEPIARQIRDPFLALGINLAVDGARPHAIREIMNNEVAALAARHRQAKKVVELVGRCGPAFGMIATLLGLILMLGSLSKPATVGPSMALALVGTLYGVLLANLVCIPLCEKLGYLSQEEQISRQIIIHGVLAIQAGDIPRVIRQKLDMFLPPPRRLRPYIRANIQPPAKHGDGPLPSESGNGPPPPELSDSPPPQIRIRRYTRAA
jgi:chemotaxis protein MotA